MADKLVSDDKNVLDGVKVPDVASFIFGPACAAAMADFGADVVITNFPPRVLRPCSRKKTSRG